jgi:hypothetical protein
MRSSRDEEAMKMLWLKNNLLCPFDSGGKIRTYQMLRKIREMHEIHFVAFADANRDVDSMRGAGGYYYRLFTAETPRISEKNPFGYCPKVLGTVRDTRSFVDLAAVAVVPTRIGGSMRKRISEMMAMQTGIVAPSISAEGLSSAEAKNILIAETRMPTLRSSFGRTRNILRSISSLSRAS